MKTKVATLKDERMIILMLAGAIVLLCMTYVYCMNETVFNVAKRASLGKEIAALTSDVSQLEFKYISLGNTINIDLAYSLGYKEVSNPRYISRAPLTAQLPQTSIQ